ncbi:Clathrin adaptor complex small chain [Fragilaria crotonensis]|nr:Clathrin adaptor complex small chain [Fragilaria crotonensis]
MNNNNNSDDTKKGACGWHFMVLMSRQGKIRLSEFFSSFSESESDAFYVTLPRTSCLRLLKCAILLRGTYKFVYRRYASLYFVAGVPLEMNELLVLEQIHLFVEALDGYFNSVSPHFIRKCLLVAWFVNPAREVLKQIVEAEELVEEMTKPGEDTASQLDDGLSFQEQFQLGRKRSPNPGRTSQIGLRRCYFPV